MKKESKGRYKVSEQLSDKTSALIMIASGISVLLLMIYFGMSLTSKGTFSAESFYTCANGVLSEYGAAHMCCPSDYPTLGRVVTTDTLYPLSSGGYLCQNSNYNSNAIRTGAIGSCLSTQYNDPMTGTVDCPAAGGTYVAGTGCYLPCATEPLGQASYVSCDYSYVGAPSNGVMTISNPNSGCECPSGWTKNGNNCTTTVSNGTNSTYYARGGMDSCYTAGGYEYAADGNCRKCDSGYVFTNSSNNTCIDEDLPNSSNDPRCTWGDYNESLHRCEVTCNVSVVSNPTKTSCENEFNGYTCEEQASNIFICYGGMPTCNVTINDCILEGDIIDGRVDATLTMTTPVTYKYKWEFSGDGYAGGVPSEFQANWQSVPTIPKRIDVFTVKTNESGPITAKITVLLSTGATCTDTKNLTVTPCTDCGGGSGGGETVRADQCYKTGDNTGVIAWVQTCSKTSSEIQGVTCSSLNDSAKGTCYISYSNSNGQTVTATVPRCSIMALDDPACSTTPDPITCYYCDSNNTRRSYNSTTGACDNSSYPPATTDSNLDCNPSTPTTCYQCNGTNIKTINNVQLTSGESCEDKNYLSSGDVSQCRTYCYRCDGTSIVNDVYVEKGKTCESGNYLSSNDESQCKLECWFCDGETEKSGPVPKNGSNDTCAAHNLKSTKAELNCKSNDKLCYYCENTSSKSFQLDSSANGNCANSTLHPGATDDSNLKCAKDCWTCEGTTEAKKTIPISQTCAANGYKDNKNQLDCAPETKKCYYCEGESRKSFTLETSANGNCANSTAHPGATDDSNLKCVEEVKCCACENSNKVTKGNSTNGKCPSGQTICSELVCKNSQTGTSAIVIAWLVGIIAIGYSFYYFRKTNKQQ